MKAHSPAAQRGAATIAITLMLVFAILLSVAFANRSMLFEAKSSANQYHAAQAFEAAEAGLDWAIAQLNSDTPIGDDCQPGTDAAAVPLKARNLADLQLACMQRGIGFSIQLTAADHPDLLQLTSMGHSAGTGANGVQVQVLVGRLPGLDSPPTAALTVRGTPSFASTGFGVHHTDPVSGGLTLHSGGVVDITQLQLVSTPGTPASTSVLGNDPALAQLSASGLFASLFRMDKTAWRTQPTVHELACQSACDAALAQATANTAQLIWLRGGLHLDTPLTLGTPERPVLLVVDGPIEFNAAARVHGMIYAAASSWVDTGGASIYGAVVAEGDLQAVGATQIHHDAIALQALRDHTGTFARVPGSWRDF